jgi:hypothetical protein
MEALMAKSLAMVMGGMSGQGQNQTQTNFSNSGDFWKDKIKKMDSVEIAVEKMKEKKKQAVLKYGSEVGFETPLEEP